MTSPIKIADFFAKIGFQVDTAGLNEFVKVMDKVKATSERLAKSMAPKKGNHFVDEVLFKRRQIELKKEAADYKDRAAARLKAWEDELSAKAQTAKKVTRQRLKEERDGVKREIRDKSNAARIAAKNRLKEWEVEVSKKAGLAAKAEAGRLKAERDAVRSDIRSKAQAAKVVADNRLKAERNGRKLAEKDQRSIIKQRLDDHTKEFKNASKVKEQLRKQDLQDTRSRLKQRLGEHTTSFNNTAKVAAQLKRQELNDQREMLRLRLKEAQVAIKQRSGDQRSALKNRVTEAKTAIADNNKFAKSFQALQGKINPLAAATAKYKENIAILDRALKSGMISQERYSAGLRKLQSELGHTTTKVVKAKGSFRALADSINQSARGLRNFGLLAGASISGPTIFAAFTDIPTIKNTLVAASGSTKQAAKDFAFLEAESNRLGVSIRETSKGFVQLSASTLGSSLEGQATKDLFSATLEVSRSLNMSTEATEGAIRSFSQMVSKGKVQAEELRGQLGEHLPGAFRMAAEGLGVTTEKLNEMLKAGEVTAEELLPALTQQMRKLAATNLDKMTSDATAELKRLGNAILGLTTAFGEGGFLENLADIFRGLTKVIKELTPLFRSLGRVIKFLFQPTKALFQILNRIYDTFQTMPHWMKLVIAALVAIKVAFILAGTAALAAWRKILLPAILIGAFILIVNSLIRALEGKSSAIRNAANSNDAFAATVGGIVIKLGEFIQFLGELAAAIDLWDFSAFSKKFQTEIDAMKAIWEDFKNWITNTTAKVSIRSALPNFGVFSEALGMIQKARGIPTPTDVNKLNSGGLGRTGGKVVTVKETNHFNVTVPEGTPEEQAKKITQLVYGEYKNLRNQDLQDSLSNVADVE